MSMDRNYGGSEPSMRGAPGLRAAAKGKGSRTSESIAECDDFAAQKCRMGFGSIPSIVCLKQEKQKKRVLELRNESYQIPRHLPSSSAPGRKCVKSNYNP